jgi:hypothetical protein
MRGTRALQVARVTPPGGRTCPCTILLDVPPHSLFPSMTRVDGSWAVNCR